MAAGAAVAVVEVVVIVVVFVVVVVVAADEKEDSAVVSADGCVATADSRGDGLGIICRKTANMEGVLDPGLPVATIIPGCSFEFK